MVAFEVKDMSCGGCASSIAQAVQARDSAASVKVDVARRRVEISGSVLDPAALAAAIASAGYIPVLPGATSDASPRDDAKVGSGCCCCS
jgi:copper chaperone